MSVCVQVFFSSKRDGELLSFSLHTHPQLLPLSVCLTLLHYCTDFPRLSRLINKSEVADSRVLAN